MGIACLENEKLLYHGVMTIPKKKSPREILKEARKIALRLIKDLRPKIVAVEKTFSGSNAALLKAFTERIGAIAKRKGLQLFAYAPSTVKKFVCGNGWAGKKQVTAFVISKYPELKVYISQDRAWKEKYHQHMFDAVAVGMTAYGA
jgi:Holliday junction resolvasome RuvABC endonuclease subunit